MSVGSLRKSSFESLESEHKQILHFQPGRVGCWITGRLILQYLLKWFWIKRILPTPTPDSSRNLELRNNKHSRAWSDSGSIKFQFAQGYVHASALSLPKTWQLNRIIHNTYWFQIRSIYIDLLVFRNLPAKPKHHGPSHSPGHAAVQARNCWPIYQTDRYHWFQLIDEMRKNKNLVCLFVLIQPRLLSYSDLTLQTLCSAALEFCVEVTIFMALF